MHPSNISWQCYTVPLWRRDNLMMMMIMTMMMMTMMRDLRAELGGFGWGGASFSSVTEMTCWHQVGRGGNANSQHNVGMWNFPWQIIWPESNSIKLNVVGTTTLRFILLTSHYRRQLRSQPVLLSVSLKKNLVSAAHWFLSIFSLFLLLYFTARHEL